MKIETTIDPVSRIPTHTATGVLSANRVRQAVRKLVDHPEYRPDHHSLWDLRQAEGITDADAVWAVVDMIRAEEVDTGRGITAVLLPSELFFALGEPRERFYRTGRERAKVFDDPVRAAEWLENHEHRRDG